MSNKCSPQKNLHEENRLITGVILENETYLNRMKKNLVTDLRIFTIRERVDKRITEFNKTANLQRAKFTLSNGHIG